MEGKAKADSARPSAERGSLGEVAGLFLRLGFLAFGGPAAHIAMMQDEVVERRKWVSRERFLDLLGITNLIPGPNSTEMAIHLGYVRAGWKGLVIAGVSFIAPAALIVYALARLYAEYGGTPEASWLLYGVKPVIIAIVMQALLRLGKSALKDPAGWVLGAALFGLYLVGANEIALLFAGGLVHALFRRAGRKGAGAVAALPLLGEAGRAKAQSLALGAAASALAPFSFSGLFFTFLKIGAVLYGSGYVLLAFLRSDFVERLGWITDQELLDAVAVGQFTPGPVFTTATFIGYLVGGGLGAFLATLGIFLPSFLFVGLIHPLAHVLRRSPWTAAFLDGVNIAALALMAGVLVQLGASALVDPLAWALAALSLTALLRWRINSAWLILIGAAAGWGRWLAS